MVVRVFYDLFLFGTLMQKKKQPQRTTSWPNVRQIYTHTHTLLQTGIAIKVTVWVGIRKSGLSRKGTENAVIVLPLIGKTELTLVCKTEKENALVVKGKCLRKIRY